MNTSQACASLQAAALVGSVTNSSTVKIYTGTIPTTPETALGSQTLLATVTLPSSSAFTQTNGVMTAAAITSVTIAATGTAAWFRWAESGGTVLGDGYVGANSGYSAWAQNTAYSTGNFVTANSNTYICTTAGTSGTTGTGPAAASNAVKDGTVTWALVELLLNATPLVAGASLAPSAFTFTVPSV